MAAPNDSSQKTAEKKVKKKPGNKGDFLGLRLEFLLSRLDDYLATSTVGQMRLWWPKLMNEYWCKFNWRLDRNEEPVDGTDYPPNQGLSADEISKKTKIMEDTKQVSGMWHP
jgi:hypothetical protein